MRVLGVVVWKMLVAVLVEVPMLLLTVQLYVGPKVEEGVEV